jgi:hypothetical protein
MLRRAIAGQGETSPILVGPALPALLLSGTGDHDRVLTQIKINDIERKAAMIGI